MKKAALVAALALSLTGFAQNGKIGFRKGQKLEVTTETRRESSADSTDQPMEQALTSTVTSVYDVQNVTTRESVLGHRIKRLAFSGGGPGESESYDSEKESDRKSEMGRALKRGIKDKYTLTLDPSGKITAVKLEDDYNPENDPLHEMLEVMIVQTGLPLSIPKAGTASIFHVLPARTLKQRDTWTDSSSIKDFRQKSVYTVTGVTASEVMLDFTEDQNLVNRIYSMGIESTLTTKNKSTGKMIVDRKTGILRQKTYTTDVETIFKGEAGSTTNQEKATTTITVKTL